MARELARLKFGEVYNNRGGEEYRCVTPQWLPYPVGEERMQNVKTGWTFRAHGIVQYQDGSIEWDYSTGGYFEERGSGNAQNPSKRR